MSNNKVAVLCVKYNLTSTFRVPYSMFNIKSFSERFPPFLSYKTSNNSKQHAHSLHPSQKNQEHRT